MKRCSIGGQAVMEGVMMKSEHTMALAVRKPDGTIAIVRRPNKTRAKKGTFLGLPVVRGVVTFVEALTEGMTTLTQSAELAGEAIEEKPSKFEEFLAKALGKSVDKVVTGLAVVLAIGLAVGLFFFLPTLASTLALGAAPVANIWRSLLEGGVRLALFLGYIIAVGQVKDIRRVFMYHGAEHKTIACYEAELPLTVENAMAQTRLHPRCGTNYMFLVMAISILFFAAIGWSANFWMRLGSRLLFLPLVAGISYEVLKLAGKSDGIIARIVRAPGLALQKITTKEPTPDMVEVAITAFNLAANPEAQAQTPAPEDAEQIKQEEAPPQAAAADAPRA